MNGGHPQVGGTGVKHHTEGLRRGTQGNVTIILGLKRKKIFMFMIIINNNHQVLESLLRLCSDFQDSKLIFKNPPVKINPTERTPDSAAQENAKNNLLRQKIICITADKVSSSND